MNCYRWGTFLILVSALGSHAKERVKPSDLSVDVRAVNPSESTRIQNWAKRKKSPIETTNGSAKSPAAFTNCAGRQFAPGDPQLENCQRTEGRYQTPQNPNPFVPRRAAPITGGQIPPANR